MGAGAHGDLGWWEGLGGAVTVKEYGGIPLGPRCQRNHSPHHLAVNDNNGRSLLCIEVVLALGGGRERKGGRGGRVTFAASRVAVGGVRDHGASGRRGCQLRAGAVFSQAGRVRVWAAAGPRRWGRVGWWVVVSVCWWMSGGWRGGWWAIGGGPAGPRC